jgi:hypothetical protein
VTVKWVYINFLFYEFQIHDSEEKDFTKQRKCCTIKKLKKGGAPMEEKKCLKCARPCQENQAFCDECLADMRKHPVKPGVVVLLPQQERRTKAPARRRHVASSPEEQLAKLKKRVTALWLALILSLSAAGVLGYVSVTNYLTQKENRPLPGQNYSGETSVSQEKQP